MCFFERTCILFKKRFTWIKRDAVAHGIPFVAPPFFVGVNWVDGFGRMIGDDLLAAQIALSMIEMTLIAKTETELATAVRAKGWWGNGTFLVTKGRGDLVIEDEIIRCDLE